MSNSLAQATTARPVVSRRVVRGGPRSNRRPGRTAGPPRRQAVSLLADAERGLDAAIRAQLPGDRYAAAHLAALRGAAALLATRPQPRRGRLGNAWDLLAAIGPEYAEWAAFFRAGAAKRQLAEAGNTRVVGPGDADAMLRRTGQFLDLVREGVRATSR